MKTSKLSKLVAFIILPIFCASCGTIINRTTQTLPVHSKPTEAKISVLNDKGEEISAGCTPTILKLKRGQGYFKKGKYTIRIEKPGYSPVDTTIVGKGSGWYILGNLVFGGLIGWFIVDPLSGGMWTLSPDYVNTSLPCQDEAFFNQNEGLKIVLKEQVPAEYLKFMKPLRLNN